MRAFLLFTLLGNAIFLRAQSFDFNADCRKAYNAIIALRINEGAGILAAEQKKHPDNLIPLYLQNYVDFMTIYSSDDRLEFDRRKGNKEVRIELMKAGDPSSPYFLFCAAEVNLQWAALNIKFGEYMNAIFEIKKAFKFLVENQQRFPDFKPNLKSMCVMYALLGSVPDKYKWGLNLLGLDGNVEQGLTGLELLIRYGKTHDYIYQEETVTYYAFLLLHLMDNKEKAWQVLKDNGLPKKDNLMNVYTCAHIGIYGKHNDEALKILEQKPVDSSFAAFPFLYYLEGLGRLNRLDSGAGSRFIFFLQNYKGENHIKSALQKIAWCFLLSGNKEKYAEYIKKAGRKGITLVDADKQAEKEAETGKAPNVTMLRARLLFDGAYYAQAEKEMGTVSEAIFKTTEDQTEYLYRLGRIYHEWQKQDSALLYYARAIEKGKTLPRYFAANSAFESGVIYEGKGEKEKAKTYYTLALSFENHEYKNGIDQKAKAALNRLK